MATTPDAADMAITAEVLSGVVHPWHVDTLGHMNARWYAHLLDDASFQFWARKGLGQQQMRAGYGVATVTASTKVDFLREIRAGDCYIVSGGPTRVGGKSVTLEFSVTVLATGAEHARFTTVEVFVEAETHQSVTIPEAVRARLQDV
jgi:acyl-CoA thioesterase FadM